MAKPATRTPGSLRCTATLQRPAHPKHAAWRFLVLPAQASAKLPSRGMVSVAGTLDGHAFKATLEPDGQRSHWLKVPRALREAAGVDAGDTETLHLAPVDKEPEPRLPADLREALAAAPAARAQWAAITPAARRDFVQWVTIARQADRGSRRVCAAPQRGQGALTPTV